MKIDMSPQAITRRLRQCSELRRLCIALGSERLRERFKTARIQADAPFSALSPERTPSSPLDVPSISADVTTKEMVDMVREGGER